MQPRGNGVYPRSELYWKKRSPASELIHPSVSDCVRFRSGHHPQARCQVEDDLFVPFRKAKAAYTLGVLVRRRERLPRRRLSFTTRTIDRRAGQFEGRVGRRRFPGLDSVSRSSLRPRVYRHFAFIAGSKAGEPNDSGSRRHAAQVCGRDSDSALVCLLIWTGSGGFSQCHPVRL